MNDEGLADAEAADPSSMPSSAGTPSFGAHIKRADQKCWAEFSGVIVERKNGTHDLRPHRHRLGEVYRVRGPRTQRALPKERLFRPLARANLLREIFVRGRQVSDARHEVAHLIGELLGGPRLPSAGTFWQLAQVKNTST